MKLIKQLIANILQLSSDLKEKSSIFLGLRSTFESGLGGGLGFGMDHGSVRGRREVSGKTTP